MPGCCVRFLFKVAQRRRGSSECEPERCLGGVGREKRRRNACGPCVLTVVQRAPEGPPVPPQSAGAH
ncbi:hypothetical protein HJG60_009617 [Phyllostomus discolor]|uniref:Uncharacterized protein n=1 Tax=Phyllostomus discolor TaxID=89673 RepID=A0A834DB10_9CHIR|nr:hypothetical protein HJG60_009617 [Phyllostomus discolor]